MSKRTVVIEIDGINHRHCASCKDLKPFTDYSPARGKNLGIASICKVCAAERARIRYHADPLYRADKLAAGERYRKDDPIKYRNYITKYHRGRRELYRKRVAERRRKDPKFAKQLRQNVENFYASNPLVKRAHNLVREAVKAGKLIKQPCVICGAERAQAHHDDYNKPLDVIWYCPLHHAAWHKLFIAEGGSNSNSNSQSDSEVSE